MAKELSSREKKELSLFQGWQLDAVKQARNVLNERKGEILRRGGG